MGMKNALLVVALVVTGCGTRKNPALCCNDAADCASVGLTEASECGDGLLCRGNQCVAESCTSSSECEGGAPFCSAAGLCAPTCDEDSQCPGFGGGASDIYCDTGACVACRTNADCASSTAPVCGADHACRGCEQDSECNSNVCSSTGACVEESAIVYLSPTGGDGGGCTKTAPCLHLSYAITQTSAARPIVTMTEGDYAENTSINIGEDYRIDIHGNGSAIAVGPVNATFINASNPIGITIRDLTIDDSGATAGNALQLDVGSLYDIDIIGGQHTSTGLFVGGQVDAHGLTIAGGATGITVNGALTLDRGSVRGTVVAGINVNGSLVATNTLVVNGTATAIYATHAQSIKLSFSTLISTQVDGDVDCPDTNANVSDSIIWNPNAMNHAGTSGNCILTRSIVGPVPVAGAQATDPKFVNMAAGDYHLSASSPAIDFSPQGPPFDVDGDPRPQGTQFDIGADEYKP